jgi:Zn-dependent protease with chaperone function
VTILLPLLLVSYAIAAAALGAWWLARASWPRRMPRLGIAAWQVLTVTTIVSVLVAGTLAAAPCLPTRSNWNAMTELREHYASPGRVVIGLIAAGVTVTVIARMTWAITAAMALARSRRAHHDEALALLGRPGPVPGMMVLENDRPAVYCVPGRKRIVCTTGALDRLDRPQLQAVLAHEHAHLAGRHHLVIMLARVLERAFPGIQFLATAADEIGCLVEMAADDSAARQVPRLALARALLALATSNAPAGVLNAAGTAGAQRIRRLLETPRPHGSARRKAGFAVTLLTAPVLALAAPAVALLLAPQCLP